MKNKESRNQEKVTKPIVRTLALGKELVAKQMQAKAGELLPKHMADLESLLFIHEGECNFNLDGEDIHIKQGEGFVVPAKIKHQIKALTDFKGVHFMPRDIKFTFYN